MEGRRDSHIHRHIGAGKHSEGRQKKNHEHRSKSNHTGATGAANKYSEHGSKQHRGHATEQNTGTNNDIVSEYFVSDRKGDPGIIQYGSNNSYRVPPYRRIGYGLVLGLSRAFKIDKQSSTERSIVLIDSRSQTARNKGIFAKLDKSEEYRVHSAGTTSNDLHLDFLAFRTRRKRANHSSGDSSEDSADENDATDYRSTHGKAKPSDLVDKDLELNTSQTTHGLEGALELEATLSRAVRDQPDNGQAWMDLIQQKFARNTESKTYAERISTADIKISMYEKALKSVRGSFREALLQGLLKEASLIWDHDKLQKKWQEVLQSETQSFVLWREYLNYVQTNPVRFKFDDLKDTYNSCFAIFKKRMIDPKNIMAQQERFQIANGLIYVLLRFTICLQQAGYVEQAIAIWQANLERLIYSTSKISTANQFESFWESEVARIGEKDALGLDTYLKRGGNAPIEVGDPERPMVDTLHPTTWVAYETKMSHLLPARTLDITDEEDAFRIVMYSDIEPYFLDLPPEMNENLLDALLLFSGLPPIWQQESQIWMDDPFIYGGSSSDLASNIPGEVDLKVNNGFKATQNCLMTTEILFARESPFPLIASGSEEKPGTAKTMSNINVPLRLGWIRNILRDLTIRGQQFEWFKLMEYSLAFELYYFPQQAKKSSKNALKTHPKHVPLYNVHALIEYRLGNDSAAEKVLQTAIKMLPEDPNVALLKKTLMWETLERNDTSSALGHLLDGSRSFDEGLIFRKQQDLLSDRDKSISDANQKHLLPIYVDCLVLLSYLSSSNSLDTALAIFDANLSFVSSRLSPKDLCIEMMHQNLARLIQYHIRHHHYKPSIVRTAVRKSIEAFPTNTIFLSLFQLNERRYRINDRVRSVVNDVLSKDAIPGYSSPLIGYLLAIDNEMNRSVSLGSSIASIRSAFERALNNPETKSSPEIWRMYMRFERSRNDVSGDGVEKKVALRSLVACPWVLEFFVLAIKLINDMSNGSNVSEFRSYYDAIVDRELRLHMSLDEDFWRSL